MYAPPIICKKLNSDILMKFDSRFPDALTQERLPFCGCGDSADLSLRCQVLDGIKLKNVCTDAYPLETRQKYADKHVKPGLSYTVFAMDDRKGYYMISHGYSDLTKCNEITVTSPRDFECNGNDIRLKSGKLYCLLFHTQITDDLISHCSGGGKQPKAAFTAMHYVYGSTIYGEDEIGSAPTRIIAVRNPELITINQNIFILFDCLNQMPRIRQKTTHLSIDL
uniref:Uncharacterized protein n=1 Tax=Glossina austeni TaxID=7395 RepID=A0A1A9VGY7_GLOAU